MQKSFLIMLALIFALILSVQCTRQLSRQEKEKIRFNYSAIDAAGLRKGESSVDYEFCIPASEGTLSEVTAIEPDVRVLKNSKGRIRCSDTEWLCIINTHDPEWRRKLYSIAALSYVDRIEETFYE